MATETQPQTERFEAAGRPERPVKELLRELADQVATLAREEVALVKREMSDKAKTLARNAVSIAGGGLVIHLGAMLLLAAVTAGVYVVLNTFAPWWVCVWLAPLIVGVVVAVVGYAMIRKGISTLKREKFMPQQTVDSLRENKQWLASKVS
jgi:hypothetical protein